MTGERKGLSKASLKGLRSKQRMEVMRQAAVAPGVRVVPANDDVRRLMKHPHAGGFPESGATTWPEDRFTKRRLADGAVTREEPPPEGEGAARQRDQREQSRHRVEPPTKAEPKDAA
ncbi:hypothetical protein [Bradyrhizobium cytisi]|uniref:Uncharacterized protein n=1 Tax=Bradyrhizobium cytisi TaxID=515489 RepID=A0A5S4WZI8_9BRAD|nr:hypothetical protein [Bradyrhizobium cytisi]TYL87435.1 hypothetical protein FXB38_04775 [Bradyrhizobium cytisi]